MQVRSSTMAPGKLLHMSDWQVFSATAFSPRAEAATSRLAALASSANVRALAYTGDLTNNSIPEEWASARKQMLPLLSAVPRVCINNGNHDAINRIMFAIDDTFPVSERPYLTANDSGTNSWCLVDLGGKTWGIACAEWGPRDSTLSWLGDAIAAHPTVPWIFCAHAYLTWLANGDTARFDWNRSHDQGNPHYSSWLYPDGWTPNDGQEIWTKLIEPHSNIKIVLCGHDVTKSRCLTSTRADGSTCHQMIYSQHATVAWNGTDPDFSVALVSFDHANREYVVEHYSPESDTYSAGFRLPMDATT